MTSIVQDRANSALLMRDIYFPFIEIKQNKDYSKLGQTQLQVKYGVKMTPLADCLHGKEICITVDIFSNADDRIKIHIEAIGVFELQKTEKMKEDDIEKVFKYNAVAIMLPFVRSQVSLATTQPGVSPVLLQPVDVMKLYQQ